MLGIVCCETWTFPSKLQIAKDWLNKKQEGDEQCLFGTKRGGRTPYWLALHNSVGSPRQQQSAFGCSSDEVTGLKRSCYL
jgi:hypothetical protein